ncbi:MAG: hypothetical protein JWO86_4820 [Myxococcaceae bacterium]|nr:hypothetical protein [Myxococcaceae bacterium]
MRLGVRRIAFVVALGAAGAGVACSLTTDLNGFSEPFPRDAGSDVFVSPDTSVIVDAAPEASVDSAPPPCIAQTTIDTPLTSTLDMWSPRSSMQSGGYPKVESFFGMKAAVLLPFVDTTPVPIDAGDPDAGPTFFYPPERNDAIGGIWRTTPVALRSFDVAFDFFVKCTKNGSCADGFAFVWLDTTAVANLSNKNSGSEMGIPALVSGGAVFADNHRNDSTESSDPPVPALEIVKLEAAKTVGHYPWVVASKGINFIGAWHKLAISVRGDVVTVAYDGAPAVTGMVPSVVQGLVGLSAGTGGETDAVAVRNVKASFYDCVP